MAGKWDLSGTQRIGTNGRLLVGARAYFYQAGTLTPLTTYTDYSLADENPAFVETDGNGTWPAVYFDDSEDQFYRVRATTAGGGTILFDFDAVPIIGPGDGGGDPPTPVDPNALFETGDIKCAYGTGSIAGWVRANGRTIGSATSGASERADADTQILFETLYTRDTTLAVSGGRGASATADFEANKTIALPDFRGRIPTALDDMGNSAAGILTGFTTLGEAMGAQSVTLAAGNIPQITGTTSSDGLHGHPTRIATTPADSSDATGGIPLEAQGTITNFAAFTGTPSNTAGEQIGGAGSHTHTVTAGSSSPTAVANVQPSIAVTYYIKL